MTSSYLPRHARIDEACEWMTLQTGQKWTLARLLESGLMPWFWIDYKADVPAVIFNGRIEGYLAPVVFAGDTQRLAADGSDALVNITRTAGGVLMKVEPAMRMPLSELRFKSDDLRSLASRIVPTVKSAAQQSNASPEWTVTRPKRYQGYAQPLFSFLQEEKQSGRPKPTASDVLGAWGKKKPTVITEVMTDGIKYQSGLTTKIADLDAIRKAIARMTTPNSTK